MVLNASARLTVLNNEWHGCTRCELHQMRNGPDIFFGYGVKEYPKTFMIVGGAPTEADELFHSVFAGDDGDLLLELLKTVGIQQKDCFFTYSVACRPKVFIPATDTDGERIENRPPAKEETTACRPRLYEQLYLTDPRVIITVGEVATKAMVRGRLPKFIEAVGKQYTCSLPAASKEDREDGKTLGKSRYHDIAYAVLAIPEMSTIINNPSTADHGPYNVALRTLTRAKQYADFVTSNEQKTMEGVT